MKVMRVGRWTRAWDARVGVDAGSAHGDGHPRRLLGAGCLCVLSAVTGRDQYRGQDRPGHGEPGADEECPVEPLGQRDRRAWTPLWSRLWVWLFATVARIARPSAPPTCCAVLIRPEARPASCGLVPVTAAMVTGTNANPSPTAASSDGPSTSAT